MINTNSPNTFDSIIIGSGMGGMTTASLLSRFRGQKVLLLEKHGKMGGFTHTFKRPKPDSDTKLEFDVGIHYVGEMGAGKPLRNAFDQITDGKVDWAAMPEIYDVFQVPGLRFEVPKGEANFQSKLITLFPDEERAIKCYFKDLKRAVKWMQRNFMIRNLPNFVARVYNLLTTRNREFALQTVKNYLDQNFKDPRLKAILPAQWGDYGLPPSRCPLATHAMIATHYLNGAYYPVGGAVTIATAVKEIIEKAGGKILLRTPVKKTLVENGKAIGIETQSGEKYFAKVIYSNAGIRETFENLLERQDAPDNWFSDPVRNIPEYTVVNLFVGLKSSAKTIGIKGENYWIYDTLDQEEALLRQDELLKGRALSCYLSFPSLKDPKNPPHCAEILAPISRAAFDQWNGTEKSKRGENYLKAKEVISKALLELVEKNVPGFSSLIDFQELSTPLTIEHYTSHWRGSIYGVGAERARLESTWFKPKTPLTGLYLCGTDAAGHGIAGSMSGGILAVAAATGYSIFGKVYRPFKEVSSPL